MKSVGYLSETEDLALLYSACDVYVHLSREDTFGKVIAEAMACGTPVIVYNLTACPETAGLDCGFAVDPGDIDAILRRVEDVKEKGKAAFSQKCLEYAHNNFAKSTLVQDTLALYKRMIGFEEEKE